MSLFLPNAGEMERSEQSWEKLMALAGQPASSLSTHITSIPSEGPSLDSAIKQPDSSASPSQHITSTPSAAISQLSTAPFQPCAGDMEQAESSWERLLALAAPQLVDGVGTVPTQISVNAPAGAAAAPGSANAASSGQSQDVPQSYDNVTRSVESKSHQQRC